MLTPLRRRRADAQPRGVRRGVYLLPSLFTMANMFCGYACIVYSMRGEFATAAPFIGFAIVLDMLDGRVARMTGATSEFGVEFDSLADVISFGVAPAILVVPRGACEPLGRLGWAVGFPFRRGGRGAAGSFQHSVRHAGQALLRRTAEPRGGRRPGRDSVCVSCRFSGDGPRASGARHGDRAGAADGQHDPIPQLQDFRPAVAAQLSGAAARGARHRPSWRPSQSTCCW